MMMRINRDFFHQIFFFEKKNFLEQTGEGRKKNEKNHQIPRQAIFGLCPVVSIFYKIYKLITDSFNKHHNFLRISEIEFFLPNFLKRTKNEANDCSFKKFFKHRTVSQTKIRPREAHSKCQAANISFPRLPPAHGHSAPNTD